MNQHRAWTSDEVSKAVGMFGEGYTVAEIAEALGRPKCSVHSKLNNEGACRLVSREHLEIRLASQQLAERIQALLARQAGAVS